MEKPITSQEELAKKRQFWKEHIETWHSSMWVFRGWDPDRPALVGEYHPTRSGKVPFIKRLPQR